MLKACKGIPRHMMKVEDYEALANGENRNKAMDMMLVRRLKGDVANVGVAMRPNAHRLVRGVNTEVIDDIIPDM